MKKDSTIRVTSEISLVELLDEVRSNGRIRLEHGKDVFVIELVRERLSDNARDFLTRGGPVDGE